MWFALTVKPNHEHTATRALMNQDFEAYLPLHRVRRQWSDRTKEMEAVLFPGYVFCRFDSRDRSRVLNSAGVRSIVGSGKDAAPVCDSEIDSIRALIASRRPILPWPFLRPGEPVTIRSGPLVNLRGIIVRVKDSLRAVVSVEALSCSVAIEVDMEDLEKSTWPIHNPAIEPSSFGSLRKSTTA
jgi:transcription antitermination factor NusG